MFERLRSSIINFFSVPNKFNKAFLVDGGYTLYDTNQQNYIKKGYKINPTVYSIINQMSAKTAAVPMYVKKVEDEDARKQLDFILRSTKGELDLGHYLKYTKLKNKAYSTDYKELPLERPNVYQTWTEFIALYKTFIRSTGNVFLYWLAPEEGLNAGQPIQVFLLPSHLMQIVTKPGVSYLEAESPIDYYILTYGKSYIEFEADKVVHIKYSNPNYDENGRHLYGQSPLEAALKNIQTTNEGLDNNIKTMKSGGAFGLFYGKNNTLTPDIAQSMKERLKEMDADPSRLGKIAGVSAEIGFQRISLTSDELKPFDYFGFDEKKIADCLQWELIDSNRGDYGGTIKEIRRQRVVDNIQPDLQLLEDALNNYFLPLFKGYEDYVWCFDVMELPEMQTDVKEVTEWLNNALDRGVISRNEYRQAIRYMTVEDDAMDRYTVNMDVIGLDEALQNDFQITQ
jgi:hypothetical protein